MTLRPEVIGWEKAALGTAIFSPETVDIATAEGLRYSDFTGSHQHIWAEIVPLHTRQNLDPRSLIETLRERNLLDGVGSFDAETTTGEAYIHELLTFRGTSMQEYATSIMRASARRELVRSSGLILAEARDTNVELETALTNAEERLINLRIRRGGTTGHSLADILAVYIPRVDGMRKGTIAPAWTPVTREVRDIVMYAESNDFILVAARPGEGKSSYLRHEALASASSGIGTLMFNMENSEIEYARHAIAYYLGWDNAILKNATSLSDHNYKRIIEAADELAELPFHVVTLGGPSVTTIDAITRTMMLKEHIDIIMIDYIQLIRNGLTNSVQDLTLTSQTIRSMALRLDVPIIAAAQLNRAIEHRTAGSEPQLSDLRESGSLEQDATQVWFTRRLWQEPSANQLRTFSENVQSNGQLYLQPKAEPMRMFIKKNRNGPIGTTPPMLWNKSTGHFTSLDHREVDLLRDAE